LPADLGPQLDHALARARHQYANVELPLYQELKDALRKAASELALAPADRGEIKILAYQLLEYASCRRQTTL
jgi:hypothetical protein